MLINLLPDFFAVHNSTDRVAAYLRYFENHRRFLEAYWHNYVLDPAGPHFLEVVRSAALASRVDLRTMLERIDVVSLARNTEEQCRALLEIDVDIDVVLMVGVGAANAGELMIDGQGVAFRPAARKHDVRGTASPKLRYRLTRPLNRRSGFLSVVVNGRGIPKVLAVVGPHCLKYFRQHRSGRVIVKVNPLHALLSILRVVETGVRRVLILGLPSVLSLVNGGNSRVPPVPLYTDSA